MGIPGTKGNFSGMMATQGKRNQKVKKETKSVRGRLISMGALAKERSKKRPKRR